MAGPEEAGSPGGAVRQAKELALGIRPVLGPVPFAGFVHEPWQRQS